MTERQKRLHVNCVRCDQPLPEGLRSDSKYCSGKCRKRSRNPRIDYVKEYDRSNHERKLLYSCRNRAKEKGIPFNIDLSDIVIPKLCPVLGIELFRTKGHVGRSSPTIDRIIPSLGYVKGNVRVISHRANALKSDASMEELTLIWEDLKKLNEEKY